MAARPLAGRPRRGVQERAGDALRLAGRALLPRRADASVARLQTTYSVQLFSPFSDRWFHADGLFIIDVWLWLLLGARHRRLAAARAARARQWQRPAQAAIGIAARLHRVNLRDQPTRAEAAVRDWAATATPKRSSPRRRRSRSGGATSSGARAIAIAAAATIRSAAASAPVSDCSPTTWTIPLVREAIRRDPELRNFLGWSVLPQAEVERGELSGAGGDRRCPLRRGPAVAAGARDRRSRRPARRTASTDGPASS